MRDSSTYQGIEMKDSTQSVEVNIFSFLPIEVNLDPRLTLQDLRVLIALFSFRNKTTNVVWPSRSKLSERCRMDVTKISVATGRLEKFGWLTKEGKGGFSKSTKYELTVPEFDLITVTEQVTVTDSVTVTQQVTRGVTYPVTRGVTEQVTGKELTNELTNVTKSSKRGSRLPQGWLPSPELVAWAKAQRPDLNLREVLESFTDYWNSVAGAKGVKADWNATFRNWIRNQRLSPTQPRKTQHQLNGEATLRAMFPTMYDNQLNAIEGEVIHEQTTTPRLLG